uniref:Os01g0778700 protein n=1 Tax=Macrostomum lignano TaxID=282301 RepID=A0A1I8F6Y0_9PLAT
RETESGPGYGYNRCPRLAATRLDVVNDSKGGAGPHACSSGRPRDRNHVRAFASLLPSKIFGRADSATRPPPAAKSRRDPHSTIAAPYQTLYESSVAFACARRCKAEQGKMDIESVRLTSSSRTSRKLEEQVNELKANIESGRRAAQVTTRRSTKDRVAVPEEDQPAAAIKLQTACAENCDQQQMSSFFPSSNIEFRQHQRLKKPLLACLSTFQNRSWRAIIAPK